VDRDKANHLAGLYLQGKLIFIPRDLKEEVSGFSTRRDGQEACLLVWSTIRSGYREDAESWRHVHSNQFKKLGSSTTITKAKEWLEAEGFIQRNRSYSTDNYSQSYKILGRSKAAVVELTHKDVSKVLTTWTQDDSACQRTRATLDLITVNEEQARTILADVMLKYWWDLPRNKGEERTNLSRKEKRKREKRKTKLGRWNPQEETLYSFGLPLLHLNNISGSVVRGPKGNRLYSPLTSLKRDFRACLRLQNEPLVIFDMVCCQPTLLAHITKEVNFINDCFSDLFYERIQKELTVSRDAAKEIYCEFAYGANRTEGSGNKEAFQIQQMMEREYPATAAQIRRSKNNNYRRFSWELQKREAELFVDGIFATLTSNGIPALTIHDSIVTTGKYGQQALSRTRKEIKERNIKGRIKKDK